MATIAIDGTKNTAYLACSVPSIKSPEIVKQLEFYREKARKLLIENSKEFKKF